MAVKAKLSRKLRERTRELDIYISRIKEILEDINNLVLQLENGEKPKKKKADLQTTEKPTKKKRTPSDAPITPNYQAVEDFFGSKEEKPKKAKKKKKSQMESLLSTAMSLKIADDDFDVPVQSTRRRRSPQEIMEEKLEQLRRGEEVTFNSENLVAYFKYCAEKAGVRYAPSWIKDKMIMSRLLEEYTDKEIIMMIEFLWYADRNYLLPKKQVGIGIFTTGWLNRIYQDANDWVNGEYDPNPQPKKQDKPREWSGKKNDSSGIGGLE